ncbi:hypothetical protein Pflav_080200 [Phytohabitans flavus]|uniref:Uncharacterized protein n=1 Tax=Phytohabitans flavus TaxID=1076124 RepID=A0A6F8Y6C0_9ACTN|nr:hypothetical protein [Phytohabitans flavus]BCB81610.1 hypothetical protein Pflav_080200 [Phytohabitans flavus]
MTAGAVVEEVGRDLARWLRPVAAAFASLAVLVAGAALWEYGRRAGTATPVDPHDVLFLAGIGHLGVQAALRSRTRRGRLRWRPALVLPGGTRPGLLARRSRWAWAIEVAAGGAVVGSGLVWGGSTIGAWEGRISSAVGVAALLVSAFAVFRSLRRPRFVAITSTGVTTEDEALPWERIASVLRDKKGVHLRLRDQVRYVTVGGHDYSISNEHLAHVIEYYLATPDRRIALDVNVPGPLGAVR